MPRTFACSVAAATSVVLPLLWNYRLHAIAAFDGGGATALGADVNAGQLEFDTADAVFVNEALCHTSSEAVALVVEYTARRPVGQGFRWLWVRPDASGMHVLGIVEEVERLPVATDAEPIPVGWTLPSSWTLREGDCVAWYTPSGGTPFGFRQGGPWTMWTTAGLPAMGTGLLIRGFGPRRYEVALATVDDESAYEPGVEAGGLSGLFGVSWTRLAAEFAKTFPPTDSHELCNAAGVDDGVAPGYFRYGDNWAIFLKAAMDPSAPLCGMHFVNRALILSRELEADFAISDFRGGTFIDIGSGSGLISLAALILSASTVVSVDAQASSVRTTYRLRRALDRLGLLQKSTWRVLQGSILDEEFLETLPRGDFVYSYGVLFTTGDYPRALRNIAKLLAPGGRLFLGLHAKEMDHGYAHKWRSFKRDYNHFPAWAQEHAIIAWTMAQLGEACFWSREDSVRGLQDYPLFQSMLDCVTRAFGDYPAGRGMDFVTDAKDWLGGYPYEWISADELIRFFAASNEVPAPLKVVKVRHEAIAGYLLVYAEDTTYWINDGQPTGYWWGHVMSEVPPDAIWSLEELLDCTDDQHCFETAAAFDEDATSALKGHACFAHLLSGAAALRAATGPEASILLSGRPEPNIHGWGGKSDDGQFCTPGSGARHRVFESGLVVFSMPEEDADPRSPEWALHVLQPIMYHTKLDLIGAEASQSSTHAGAEASRAVDGRMSGRFSDGSCTHTTEELSPWWAVELGDKYTVSELSIQNRADCCAERLFPFSVWITPQGASHWSGGEQCAGRPFNSEGINDGHRWVITVPCGIFGGKIWVVLEGRTEVLSLCEVQATVAAVIV